MMLDSTRNNGRLSAIPWTAIAELVKFYDLDTYQCEMMMGVIPIADNMVLKDRLSKEPKRGKPQ